MQACQQASTNQILAKTSGTDYATAWIDNTGGGDVSVSGTPSDNQVAIWTDSDTLEGQSTLTKPNASSLVLDNNGAAFLRLGSNSASSSSGGAIKLDHYSGGNSSIENYAFSGATSYLYFRSDDKIILQSSTGQRIILRPIKTARLLYTTITHLSSQRRQEA